jgi:hypothetical protein
MFDAVALSALPDSWEREVASIAIDARLSAVPVLSPSVSASLSEYETE